MTGLIAGFYKIVPILRMNSRILTGKDSPYTSHKISYYALGSFGHLKRASGVRTHLSTGRLLLLSLMRALQFNVLQHDVKRQIQMHIRYNLKEIKLQSKKRNRRRVLFMQ